MSFTGVICRSTGEISQEIALPKPIPVGVGAHKTWKPRAHCTVCSQINSLDNVLSMQCICSKPLSDSLAGFCFFQAAGLVLESSLQPSSSESDSQHVGFLPLVGRSLVNLVSFRDFLKLF